MKITLNTLVLFSLLLLSSCQKELSFESPSPVETPANDARYQNLGAWDDSGKPKYLLPKDPISTNLLSYLTQTLPDVDERIAHPDFLTTSSVADVRITQQSNVYITFVSQGSIALRNTLSFYTYPTNNPPATREDIKTITCIFPNAGYETPLVAGDKVKIGRFNAGTSIGFVLFRDAWRQPTHSIDSTAMQFFSTDILNPETDPNLKKHAVFVNYVPESKVLIGFEDVDRMSPNCDHDFNDVIFYATVTP
jgi:hypothetical protein